MQTISLADAGILLDALNKANASAAAGSSTSPKTSPRIEELRSLIRRASVHKPPLDHLYRLASLAIRETRSLIHGAHSNMRGGFIKQVDPVLLKRFTFDPYAAERLLDRYPLVILTKVEWDPVHRDMPDEICLFQSDVPSDAPYDYETFQKAIVDRYGVPALRWHPVTPASYGEEQE